MTGDAAPPKISYGHRCSVAPRRVVPAEPWFFERGVDPPRPPRQRATPWPAGSVRRLSFCEPESVAQKFLCLSPFINIWARVGAVSVRAAHKNGAVELRSAPRNFLVLGTHGLVQSS